MIETLISAAPVLVPVLLGVYALTFVARGVYYLEQRVTRIRDQFPRRGPLALLVGYAALGIGLLAAIAVGGHLFGQGTQFQLAALVATAAGVGFSITRIHVSMTTAGRIRAALLAILCLALTILTGWWAAP
jgi:hypothetical protein